MKTEYRATGICVGNCWGGGKVGFGAKPITAATREELDAKVEAGIQDGSIDGGMGFESVTGAVLKITELHEKTDEDGNVWNRGEESFEVFGDVEGFDEEELLHEVIMRD